MPLLTRSSVITAPSACSLVPVFRSSGKTFQLIVIDDLWIDSSFCMGYNHYRMSWWVMITTEGRLLTNVQLAFLEGEIRLYEYRLQEGEEVALLLDTYHNKARIYRPFDECQRLASRHQYELFIKRQPEETFVSHIERLLQLRHPKTEKAGPPDHGEPALRAST
jgi:hypothetical protein